MDPRGEPIHDPTLYFTVPQSVPTQKLFGFLLHATNSFDFATCRSTEVLDAGNQDTYEDGRPLTPPPPGSIAFPSTLDHSDSSDHLDVTSLANQELNEEDIADFDAVAEAVEYMPALEPHEETFAVPAAAPAPASAAPASVQGPAAASLAASSATVPAGRAFFPSPTPARTAVAPSTTAPAKAATDPTQADVPTANLPTGLAGLALAAQKAPREKEADDEDTETASTTPKAALTTPAGLPILDTGAPKQAPLTMQSAALKRAPGSANRAVSGKSPRQFSKPQAKPAPQYAKKSFREAIPTELSQWDNLSPKASALVNNAKEWRVGKVDPNDLRDLALYCKNRYHFYKQPEKAEVKKNGRILGKYQRVVFRLWGYSNAIISDVSTQKMMEIQAICVTFSY